MSRSPFADWSLYARLLRHARPYWPQIAGLFALSLLATPLALLAPLPLKLAVDSVLDNRPMPAALEFLLPATLTASAMGRLMVAVGLLVLAALLVQLQSLGSSLLTTFTGDRLVLQFRAELFRHVQRLSLAYHDANGTADSTYRIQYDAPAIQYVAIDGVIPFVSSVVKLVGMICVTALLSWRLALVALAISPILFLLTNIYQPRLRARWRELKKLESSALHVVHEVLSAMRVVKAFAREDHEHQRFVRQSTVSVQKRLQVVLAESVFNLLVGLTIAVGTAAVLFLGVQSVLAGALTLGELLLVMAYLGQLYEPLKTLGKKMTTLQSSLASAERAFAVLDNAADVPERSEAQPISRAAGAIAFRQVGFRYEGQTPVLRDVSFEVPAGVRVGISGRTGAGKTTLASLLTRFYDPTSGAILLDGVDLRDYQLRDLRNQFAIVLQEPVLFSTTIAENIAYGRPEATEAEIVAAAEAANAHDFISALPDGYSTRVGERGMRLSGGERQRISLARAFLKDAPILILDEPTSSVDVRTEQSIMEALERLMQGRTTFMIAHRLSTLEHCQLRIELQNGELALRTEAPSIATWGKELHSVRAEDGLKIGPTADKSLEAHPAMLAWRRIQPVSRRVERIDSLKERNGKPDRQKSYVYRLCGVGPDGSPVVAKRCRTPAALVERTIYEEVLPRLPAPRLQYYGFVEEPEGKFCWLFLEDARGEPYSPTLDHQRALFSRWLGRLQASAEGLEAVQRLPDRGPSHYLAHLQSGCQLIRDNLHNPALTEEHTMLLERLLRRCQQLEGRWEELTEWCDRMPRTLVHGDLVSKNVRVSPCGGEVLVFDWECAGWGSPAADLAEAPTGFERFSARTDREAYLAAVADRWPHMKAQDIARLANLGAVFRYLAAIDWAAASLAYPWVEKGMNKLRDYEPNLAEVVRAAGGDD